MPSPEGYRKALRLMKQAEKFNRPIITFVNTSGAYPGMEAEENGQGEAIARNLYEMSGIKVPILCLMIGEGGSGLLTDSDRLVAVIWSGNQNHIDVRICQHGFFCFIYRKPLRFRFFSLFFLDVIDATDSASGTLERISVCHLPMLPYPISP